MPPLPRRARHSTASRPSHLPPPPHPAAVPCPSCTPCQRGLHANPHPGGGADHAPSERGGSGVRGASVPPGWQSTPVHPVRQGRGAWPAMESLNKLAMAAKRTLPVSGLFDELIRAIGESKSKSEEDAIVARMVDLAKRMARETRRDTRTLKELLVYLMYIEMLGHDVAWAQATVIQLCSEKNLVVKKVCARGGGLRRGGGRHLNTTASCCVCVWGGEAG